MHQGRGLVLLYSAFWSLVLASFVPAAWQGLWAGPAVLVVLLTPFLLVGAWSWSILAAGNKAAGP
jgi:hypothetical protein